MKNTVRIRILRCGTMTPPAAAYPGVPKRYVRRGRVELPVSAFLIETPNHKPVLVDTGWGRAISPAGVYDYAAARAKLPPRIELPEQEKYWTPRTIEF